MSFYYANARQPEILRTVQKDVTFTNQLGHSISDLLRCSNKTAWIKYNHLCTMIAELAYHGFTSWNNLQTLGEEYTGIIQIDSKYIALPSKFLQMISIVMEFAGEYLLVKLIKNVEQEIERNPNILSEAKAKLVQCCQFTVKAIPYVQAMHRTWFYLKGGKYQISRHLTGINYVLIRYWLSVKHSIYGYKVLGGFSLIQLTLVFIAFLKELFNARQHEETNAKKLEHLRQRMRFDRKASSSDSVAVKCVLCLEERCNTASTTCGHLFCWTCILDWLNQKEECPVCREPLRKSTVVCLMNVD